jgi:hypothetical protein
MMQPCSVDQDEQMRFLDCSTGGKIPSVSIFQSMDEALKHSGFNQANYLKRNGNFFEASASSSASQNKKLHEW